jgi:hypothetical protein
MARAAIKCPRDLSDENIARRIIELAKAGERNVEVLSGGVRGPALVPSGGAVPLMYLSGGLLPPSPPAEKATARQDQAGQASTGNGGRHAHRHKVRRHVCYDFSFMGATNPKPIGCRAYCCPLDTLLAM